MVRWRSEHATGHAAVDAQRRELFGLLNELHEAVVTRRGRHLVEPTLDRLAALTAEHLDEEEALLRRVGYPDAARHTHLHQEFREKVAELVRGHRTGHVVLPLTLTRFLLAWLDTHVRDEDQKVIRHLHTPVPRPAPVEAPAACYA